MKKDFTEELATTLAIGAGILAIIIFCVAGVFVATPYFQNWRYEQLRQSDSYQQGTINEIEQILSEYEAETECLKQNSLANLILKKQSDISSDTETTAIFDKRINQVKIKKCSRE